LLIRKVTIKDFSRINSLSDGAYGNAIGDRKKDFSEGYETQKLFMFGR